MGSKMSNIHDGDEKIPTPSTLGRIRVNCYCNSGPWALCRLPLDASPSRLDARFWGLLYWGFAVPAVARVRCQTPTAVQHRWLPVLIPDVVEDVEYNFI